MKLNAIQRVLEASERLTLPNLSNMLGVGKLRFIQSVFETAEYRNPDFLVRDFLPLLLRWLSLLQGKLQLSKLRSTHFYYYLIARTKYYDRVVLDAIESDIKFIIGIGCGSDTRPYRFADQLVQKNISVFECDQPRSIAVKEQLARRNWRTGHVTYISLDLNDGSWPEFERQLKQLPSAALIMLEGVSPYVDEKSFKEFLKLLAINLRSGSRLAYDYKIRGVDDGFGYSERSKKPFRLPATKQEVSLYHQGLGFELQRMELDSELTSRLLPDLGKFGGRLPKEDCLLILTVAQK